MVQDRRASALRFLVPSISLGHEIKALAGTARAGIRKGNAGIYGRYVPPYQPNGIGQIVFINDPIIAV